MDGLTAGKEAMDISGITSEMQQKTDRAGAARTGNKNLGKDEFLQLLVAQMKNQDPINPMDGTQFAAQLAQFNSVEQLINLNSGMQALAESQQMMNSGLSNAMAASLAGKTVRALSDKVGLTAGSEAKVHFRLNSAAASVTLTVTDAAGNVVRTEKLENITGGDHSWVWDGRAENGTPLPEGTYSIKVDAKGGDDSSVSALTFIEGIAERVHYSGHGVELVVNGVHIPIGDVEDIGV